MNFVYFEGTPIDIAFPNNYGGIKTSILVDTFQEETPEYNSGTKSYLPVRGNFDILIKGPTASGIREIKNRLDRIAEQVNQYGADISDKVITLNVDGSRLPLYQLSTSAWDKFSNIDNLKALKVSISYMREALFSEMYLNYPENSFALSLPNDEVHNIQNIGSFYPSPVHALFEFTNQSYIFPSGYFLASNYPIIVISGGYFYNNYNTGYNPSSQSVVNHNNYFAYSTYTGTSLREGVLATQPSQLNVSVLSSGEIYGNGVWVPNTFPVGPKNIDVYITYKMQGSGDFEVGLEADHSYNSTVFDYKHTGYKYLENSQIPKTAYIGAINGIQVIGNANLRLDIKLKNNLGSILFIDRVILHPIDDLETHVQINQINVPETHVQINQISAPTASGADTPTTTGSNYAEFLHRYPNVNNAAGLDQRISTLRILRNMVVEGSVGRGVKIPSYKGTPEINARIIETFYNNNFDARMKNGLLSTYFIVTGSAYATASGLNNWTHTNLSNQKTGIIAKFEHLPYVRLNL